MLNVVNFGGGAYVLYAEVLPGGEIEVDPEPYSRHLRPPRPPAADRGQGARGGDRPDRRPPPAGSLALRAREDRRRARRGPGARGAADHDRRRGDDSRIAARRRRRDRGAPPARARVLRRERGPLLHAHGRALRADQRPRGLVRRAPTTRPKEDMRHFRLDRIKRARVLDETLRAARPTSTRSPTSRAGRARARSAGSRIAHVWISPEQARWAREERTVAGRARRTARSIVEWAFKGDDYLVKEVLKEAGDAAVLEPADAARGGAGGGRAPARARCAGVVSRRDEIRMTRRRRSAAFLDEERTRHLRDARAATAGRT